MGIFRTFLLTRRRLALALVVLALGVRALVPAGFMPGGADARGQGQFLAISICADGSGQDHARQMLIPVAGKVQPAAGHDQQDGKGQGACAFSALSLAALGGADGGLLAAALAFVLALGLASTPPLLLARIAGLRPPLRGPPARA